jgi:nicotinamidase-related amidase
MNMQFYRLKSIHGYSLKFVPFVDKVFTRKESQMDTAVPLVAESEAFLAFLETWTGSLLGPELAAVMPDPQQAAIISVDVIEGFCTVGALASPRVARIVDPISRLFRSAWGRGLRQIVLVQDTHEPEAVEFGAWPQHCVRGTPESQAVAQFQSLPFYDQMVTFPKNSISSNLNTGLNDWLAAHSNLDTFIVVGDCTDLCTYQLAMHLRLEANARQLRRRVIVPADCVDTYDRSVETAQKEGGLPHPAGLLHAVFLYHMALNGVEVVGSIG